MNAASTTTTTEMLGLAHLSRAMTEIVEPGQIIPNRDRIYNLVCGGDLQINSVHPWPLVLPAPGTAGARPSSGPAAEAAWHEGARPAARQSLRRFRRLIPAHTNE